MCNNKYFPFVESFTLGLGGWDKFNNDIYYWGDGELVNMTELTWSAGEPSGSIYSMEIETSDCRTIPITVKNFPGGRTFTSMCQWC